MSEYYVWPRMDRSTAQQLFGQVSQTNGPDVNLDPSSFDYSGVGQRKTSRELQELRDTLIGIAEPYGFKARRSYDAYEPGDDPGDRARSELDHKLTLTFHELVPMRWAEAGSNEVWSWFSLAFLPDLTHWRWRFARTSQRDDWNAERWIGGDLTRHTWARYWWRPVRFNNDGELIEQLNETEMTQLLERSDALGSNPKLMWSFATRRQEFYELYAQIGISKNNAIGDITSRLLRRLAYLNDAFLSEESLDSMLDDFLGEVRENLPAIKEELTEKRTERTGNKEIEPDTSLY